MKHPQFKTASGLSTVIDAYFKYIEGEYYVENVAGKEEKVYDRAAEPATIAGLALHLGFNSRHDMEQYAWRGRFGHLVKKALLHIEAFWEKRLYQQPSTVATFILKTMGYNDKAGNKTSELQHFKALKLKLIETGPKPAATESEVSV